MERYVTYHLETSDDLADIIISEFLHMTRDEAADVILKITGDFFKYYDGGNENE